MLKKSLLLAIVSITAVFSTAWAIENNSGSAPLDKQFIIYKWYENGRAHYAKIPPRSGNYVMLNEYGMIIHKDRPFANGDDTNIIRPVRPKAEQQSENSNSANKTAESVEGTITKEQRCDTARKNVQMIQTKKTIYEEDGNGNLVPLSDAQKADRLQTAQKLVGEFCE